jgi:hypothetical protein
MRMKQLACMLAMTVAGCVHVQHAPGHDSRAVMAKQELRVQRQLCIAGTCDKSAPNGTVEFSDVHFFSTNGTRTETSFTVQYAGARARCRQEQGSSPIFTCRIAERGRTYELALERGCMRGSASATGTGLDPEWGIETDSVSLAGRHAPNREVSLVDAHGVLAFAEAHADDNLDIFTRSRAQLSSGQVLMLVSVQAFLQMDELPRECLTTT